LNHESHSSELFPELSVPTESGKKPAAKRIKKAVTAQATMAPAQGLEAAVALLEAHPDFRLLRRLQPCKQWPAKSGTGAFPGTARIVILDTETTGLDHSKDKIIELAMLCLDVDLSTGLPVGDVQVYDGLEDPGRPIPAEVVAITGITDADVRGQRLDEARVTELLAGVDLIIAHNAGFDRPFCEARMAQFVPVAWACSFADIDWKAQGRGSAKLENLAQSLGLFYDAHRAETDCHALLAVLMAPLPTEAHTGLAHLLAAAKKASYRLQATHAPFDAKDLLKARAYRWNADQKVWHTRLSDETALQLECDWLKEQVYHQRSAVVQVEKQNSRVKYSARSGELLHRQL
jgi:DNA polymerase-3 subunit epsilon